MVKELDKKMFVAISKLWAILEINLSQLAVFDFATLCPVIKCEAQSLIGVKFHFKKIFPEYNYVLLYILT